MARASKAGVQVRMKFQSSYLVPCPGGHIAARQHMLIARRARPDDVPSNSPVQAFLPFLRSSRVHHEGLQGRRHNRGEEESQNGPNTFIVEPQLIISGQTGAA